MADFYYSQSTNSFYPDELRPDYMRSGVWPDDAKPITAAEYDALVVIRPLDQVVAADKNGNPVLIDGPIDGHRTVFSVLEFIDLFSDDQQLSVAAATMSNAVIKLWWDKILASKYVDLGDQRTVDGLTALVASGLVQADQINQILDASS